MWLSRARYLFFWLLFLGRSGRDLHLIVTRKKRGISMNWSEILRVLLGIRTMVKVEVKQRRAKVVVRNISDLTVLIEIFLHHSYVVPMSSQEMIIIDVGSYVGYFALYCLLNCPFARIICFEPDKESCRVCRENMRSNLSLTRRVKINNWGVGGETKQVVYYHYSFAAHNSEYRFYPPVSESMVKLQAGREIIGRERVIDLLKIDTEGAEYEILYAFDKAEFAKIKRVLVETHELAGFRRNTRALRSYLKRFYPKVDQKGRILRAEIQ